MFRDGPDEIQGRVKPARNPWVFNKFLIIAQSASTGNLPRFGCYSGVGHQRGTSFLLKINERGRVTPCRKLDGLCTISLLPCRAAGAPAI